MFMLSNMNLIDITPRQLRKAARLTEKVASLEKELAGILGHIRFDGSAPAKPARKKHEMSRAGRAAIQAAQRARWAKVRAAKN
jgi:hypothetical protein